MASRNDSLRAVIGISDHIGWAEFVTVGHSAGGPAILDRRRVPLIEPGLPSAPYHHEALELPLADAARVIARTRAAVTAHCRNALAEQKTKFGAGAVVIQQSPREPLPESLSEILASWRITCAADGMMYRETLAEVAGELGMKVSRYPRREDPIAVAAKALRVTSAQLAAEIAELAKRLGKPWTKEHREAAAGALRVLAGE